MPAIPKMVSFTELHYELLCKLAKDYCHGNFSEADRLMLDLALDQNPDLSLLFQRGKRSLAQAELTAAQAKFAESDGVVRELEAKAAKLPKAVSDEVINPASRRLLTSASREVVRENSGVINSANRGVINPAPMTERGEFEHFVGNFPDPTMLGVASVRRANEMLKAHPEWLDWLAKALDEQRVALLDWLVKASEEERVALFEKVRRMQE